MRPISKAEAAQANFDIKVYENINSAIDEFVQKITDELEKEIYDIAKEIAEESRIDYVPVRTGRLRSSIHATIPTGSGETTQTSVMSAVPYAAKVHEEHPTKSHYISWPFWHMIYFGGIEDRLANAILERSDLI